jgi:hypothetical protein
MADTPFPIPASLRQTAVFLGNGSTTYGPFGDGWGIFDVADVLVETRAASPGTDPWVPATVTVTKTDPSAVYSTFSIAFASAITSATQIRVTGDRLPRRELAVSKGQALDIDQLERELSAFTVNLQELRRALKALPGIVAGDAASQAAVSAASAQAALTAIQALGVDPSGYLTKAGNLAGLANQATARTNLGLGSAATQPSTAFALAVHTHPASGVTGGIRGFSRNLRTANDAVTPLTKMLVTADELIVKDGGGIGLLLSGVNVAITMGAAGLNSLDTGTEAASTWYYLWVVSDGTNVAGLFSTSAVDCATLGAYTFKALVGAVYNDASSNFRTTRSFGRLVHQVDVLFNPAGVTSWTALSIAIAVPAIAVRAFGRVTIPVNSSRGLRLSSDSAGAYAIAEIITNTGAGTLIDGEYCGGNWDIPVFTAQTIYRKHVDATVFNIYVRGFELPLAT